MAANQQLIADFVGRRITVGRVRPENNHSLGFGYYVPYYGPPLPSPAELAQDLLRDAEFRALELGGFLNSPPGEFLEQAVELVVPRAIAPEFDVIIAGLKLAADHQRGEAWTNAVLAVGAGIAVGAVVTKIARAA